MKRLTVSWGKWCSLLFLVWFSLGVLQANAQKARGGTVKPDQRIALADSAKGTWAGQDVSIDYQYTRNQSGMSITGAVNFEDSIRYNYNRITYFQAEMIFADSDGRVLGSSGLMTTRQSHFDPAKFTRQVAVPPGAAFFAFSYKGEAVEAMGRRRGGGGNPTYIWSYPVAK
ncbi:MAG: hypothetical protein AB9866_13095 [Syntrophobacteraceae bacterium]